MRECYWGRMPLQRPRVRLLHARSRGRRYRRAGSAMTEPIKGFDVSKYQDPARVPWAELKRLGYQWCYIRAAYGLTPDPRFGAHVAMAKKHGFLWGAYLYLRDGNVTPELQARGLAGQIYGTGYSLWPCLDIEEKDPSSSYLSHIEDAAVSLSEAVGNCVIYTGAVYRVVHRLTNWIVDYPQWIADYDGPIYGFDDRTLPDAHQCSGKGVVAGYGPLDLNVAHDLDAFRVEPRAVEAVGDRVPLAVVTAREALRTIELVGRDARYRHVDALRKAVDRLADVIEQDAEEWRRNEEYAEWGTGQDAARGGS